MEPPSSSDGSTAKGPQTMFGRILLALDSGAHAPRVPVVVGGRFDRGRPETVVVPVVFPSTSVAASAADGTSANPDEIPPVYALRTKLARWFGLRGETALTRVLHGDPGERIREYADFADYDLMVREGRRRTGIARRRKGRVRRHVVANSRRSVLVIGS